MHAHAGHLPEALRLGLCLHWPSLRGTAHSSFKATVVAALWAGLHVHVLSGLVPRLLACNLDAALSCAVRSLASECCVFQYTVPAVSS